MVGAREIAGEVAEGRLVLVGEGGRGGRRIVARRPALSIEERIGVERTALAGAIEGLTVERDREGYASLLLARLMFVRFLQEARLLDDDPGYLRRRWGAVRAWAGGTAASSYSFGRDFLPQLFRALGETTGISDQASLLGRVPRLGGGLFESGRLERDNPAARVADAAFAPLLTHFDEYRWSLAGLSSDPAPPNEVRPDALGAILAGVSDRKETGAYYTADDVTAYIAASTIVPVLFDTAARHCPAAFRPDGPVWRRLRDGGDRWVHVAARKGTELSLPDGIVAGVGDVAARQGWNRPAEPAFALPAETWREHLARRERVLALRERLAAGKIAAIDDLLTGNLDLARFALDVIASAADPALVRAFGRALAEITVLDPTCGPGAFLFAALALLEPLRLACLERLDTLGAGGDGDDSRGYAVREAIVRDNLFGVDLMEEAVAICRLRLALALLAAGGPADSPRPLPDLRATVRAGDALAGSVAADGANGAGKREEGHLFHWDAEFPRPLADGGFDVVLGNPPYVGAIRAWRGAEGGERFRTAAGGNIYALVVERSLALLKPGGRCGVIVPIASVATGAMRELRALYAGRPQWHSHYATRPGKLFPGVDMNLTITLLGGETVGEPTIHSTGYRRWFGNGASDRGTIFQTLAYLRLPAPAGGAASRRVGAEPLPKLGAAIEARILARMRGHGRELGDYALAAGATDEAATVYYHSGGRYWRKALLEKLSSHYKPLTVAARHAPAVFCLLNSQLFYWYWIAMSNCMDVVAREVRRLPIFPLDGADGAVCTALMAELLASYGAGVTVRQRRGGRIRGDERNFDVRRAKPIIDAIDRTLARGYGFDPEEVDFILNYDIKYRLGRHAGHEGHEEGSGEASPPTSLAGAARGTMT